MTDAPLDPRHRAERRLLFAQIALVLTIFALVLIGYVVEWASDDGRSFGTFWFAFFIGSVGSSVALARRLKLSEEVALNLVHSRLSVLTPLMWGAMMASVAYLLFMSGVLSGDNGGGLVTTNLFPNFSGDGGEQQAPSVTAYLEYHPTTMKDAGKLMVWSFVAGYSETFVEGLLSQLETGGTGKAA